MPIPQRITDVTLPSQLESVSQALSAAPEVAVDVEADSMHHFHSRLCFVQLGTDEDMFLVDTLIPEVRMEALAAVFADPGRTKFFHAAGGDLQYLAEVGIRVGGLFDTHRAATLLGWPKVGLADLVLEKLGAKLAKEHQQADFSKRPLPPELRAYIADDVRYLCEVGRWVREACATAGILEEVLLDCQRMATEAAERPDVAQDYKVKLPKGGLKGSELKLAHALARALHALRLKWAEAADVPMGRMLSNAAIGAIATSFPKTAKELGKCEGVRGQIVREHGDEVLALIQRLIEQNRDGLLPEVENQTERDPKRRKREELLVEWRKATAVARKVTPSVVLPNPLIEDLCRTVPTTVEQLAALPWFGPKRLGLYADEVLAVLAKA